MSELTEVTTSTAEVTNDDNQVGDPGVTLSDDRKIYDGLFGRIVAFRVGMGAHYRRQQVHLSATLI